MEMKEFEKNPFLTKVMLLFAVSIVLFVLAALAFVFIKPHGIYIAISLVIISCIIDFLIVKTLLSVNCPTCSRPLKRTTLDNKTVFPCEVCGINWILNTQDDTEEEEQNSVSSL